jgi:hypothetical protein
VETQINSATESEKQVSGNRKTLAQPVIARIPEIIGTRPYKCIVNRWTLGQDGQAEKTLLGDMFFRVQVQTNAFVYVTLSVPSTLGMAPTGAIVVSDNIGAHSQPRWSQTSGALRICLCNRFNKLEVYHVNFNDAQEGKICQAYIDKGGAMWVQELVRARLPRTLIEAFSDRKEEIGLPLVPKKLEKFMASFRHDELEEWNPADNQADTTVLGNFPKTLLELQATGQQIALGPVTANIRRNGHTGHALSARLVAVSCLDVGKTELVNIDLAAKNAVLVDTQASGDHKIVLQLPSRGMTLTFFYDPADSHQEERKTTRLSSFEWLDIVNRAKSQILSGNVFVARRRARVVELEILIKEAKVRHTLWLEEQAAIEKAKEEAERAAAEAALLEDENAPTKPKGNVVEAVEIEAEKADIVATEEDMLVVDEVASVSEAAVESPETEKEVISEVSAVTLTEDMASSTEAPQKDDAKWTDENDDEHHVNMMSLTNHVIVFSVETVALESTDIEP